MQKPQTPYIIPWGQLPFEQQGRPYYVPKGDEDDSDDYLLPETVPKMQESFKDPPPSPPIKIITVLTKP